jgi:MFS family permease
VSPNFKFVPLSPGVRPINLFSFIVSSLIGFSVVVFINFLQPYLLATQLHIAQDIQGRVVSSFSVLQELVALALVPPFGHLSDRVGRRPIFAAGLIVLAGGLVAYPLAGDLRELAAGRLIIAVGAAAFYATTAAIAADYPTNKSRGKLLSILMVTQQLTILLLVAKVSARLPRWLTDFGVSAVDAGRYSFWSVAAFSAVGAVVAVLGLKRGTSGSFAPEHSDAAKPSALDSFRFILRYAKAHPRFIVVLAIAFVVRGDASVVSSFLSLWSVSAAKQQGLSASDGLQTGGVLLSYVTMSGLAACFAMGWLADRFDRLKILMAALIVAATAHLLTALVSDLQGLTAAIVISCLGAGEMSLILAGQALLGQEAPVEARGAAIGIFGFCGSIGVLFINFVGGFLFDRISYQAPFMFIGLINIVILAGAFFVLAREHGKSEKSGEKSGTLY